MITCTSCKHTVGEHQPFYYEEVVRYKSGKRKGEIKDSVKKEYNPEEHKKAFFDVVMKKDVDDIGVESREPWGFGSFVELDLKCCPECGTLFASNADMI